MYFNFDVNLPQDFKKRSVSFSLTRLCCRPPKECKLQASAVKLWLGKIEREEAREEKETCYADKVILCAWDHHSSVFHTVWTKTLWREHQGVTEKKTQWQKKDIVHLFNLTWLTVSTMCMRSVLVGLKFERTCGFLHFCSSPAVFNYCWINEISLFKYPTLQNILWLAVILSILLHKAQRS